MAQYSRASVTAVLGPTNTGKTHLAVERMCAHSSGMMGFPLRLLAREIYDRIVAIKGVHQVALITGEEKIVPAQARWFCCTAESMPVGGQGEGVGGRDGFAFVALDEAQLGGDSERGHIFTDRMLHARGREETMILGSTALGPMVRALVPDAEIISRPRFSTLSFAGARKLSRLPPRSAIVAFSAEEVYAAAEMLRRQKGGAAVVMGALSPATRNAQVTMFMNGDVDYMVATDAIGMGLNLDVAHVAFGSLTKFDGTRTRRLTVAEMAQIAGRAGRHQRDGSFGSLGAEDGPAAFRPEEVLAIEDHRFPVIEQIYWREGDPRMDSIDALIADLETRPDRPELRAAPEASDLAVLKHLAEDPDVRRRARSTRQVARLWGACGIPDFQKLGADHHARLVARVWGFLSDGNGHVPRDWFASAIARLDNVQGDIDTLSGRLAAIRSWAYIAHRPDWLADPPEMQARAAAIESRLSDALHAALRQRFVDRRTSVLLRKVAGGGEELPVDIGLDGTVQVDGETIGRLSGLRFEVDPTARGRERKMVLAAAERRLGKLIMSKAEELIAGPDMDIALDAQPGKAPCLAWQGEQIAVLATGASLLAPEIRIDKALLALGQDAPRRVGDRLMRWMAAQIDRHLAPLAKMSGQAAELATPPHVRAFLIQLAEAGGILARTELDAALALLDKDQRQIVRKAGVTIGVLDIYHPGLLKPGAAMWRAALLAARRDRPMLPLPPAGVVLLTLTDREGQMGARLAGYRGIGGDVQLRVDMIERVARAAHEAIARNERFDLAHPLVVSLGLGEEQFRTLMRNAGFRPITPRVVEPQAGEAENDSAEAQGQEEAVEAAPDVVTDGGAVEAPTSTETPAPQATAADPIDAGPALIARDSAADGDIAHAVQDALAPQCATAPPSDEALPAASEPAPVPAGANWVFRGRPRQNPQGHRPAGPRTGRPTDRSGGRARPDGPPDGSAHGRGDRPAKRSDNRGDGGVFRGPAREPKLPAGGGAFAELANLFKRDE